MGKKTKIGALIGLGVGGLAGGITGAVLYKKCNEVGFMACLMRARSRDEAFVNGVLIGGTLGVITGIIICTNSCGLQSQNLLKDSKAVIGWSSSKLIK